MTFDEMQKSLDRITKYFSSRFVTLQASLIAMEFSLIIRRQPDRNGLPTWQSYGMDLDPDRVTLLDALLKIQAEIDGSLGFRKNCRNVICGSCGMKINGKPGLACQQSVAALLINGEIRLEPLGNLPVIKDLIVDMKPFWQDLKRVDPYVDAAPRTLDQKEFIQTPGQREKLQASANCILCGACYAACNVKEVNSQFVGPHALGKAYRVLADNRDTRTPHRLNQYNHIDFAWGCTRCYQCNEVCPVGVQPLDRITEIKQALLQDKQIMQSTALKHRRTLLDLVKTAGWIDESKFALRVLGVVQLLPLGIRMLLRGKMPLPWHFRPSLGKKQIRALIEKITLP